MIQKCYFFSNYLISRAVVQYVPDYKYISVVSINDYAADGEFLDLYLKSVQENFVYKGPCVLKEK